MMWRCGVMGGIARGIDAMPLQFYDMSLGRCNVYYAVVTLLFHTVTCICELLWKCCDIYCYTDESLCQDDIAMKNSNSVINHFLHGEISLILFQIKTAVVTFEIILVLFLFITYCIM
ncbi:TPA: hypothetical protein O1879_002234 [Staphylococcus aureus]|nr:hypothetical protein [Staphylococcus aureus]